jgi:hypothetical protein
MPPPTLLLVSFFGRVLVRQICAPVAMLKAATTLSVSMVKTVVPDISGWAVRRVR